MARDDIDINKQDAKGCTPFFKAAQYGNQQVTIRLKTHSDYQKNVCTLRKQHIFLF